MNCVGQFGGEGVHDEGLGQRGTEPRLLLTIMVIFKVKLKIKNASGGYRTCNSTTNIIKNIAFFEKNNIHRLSFFIGCQALRYQHI